ITTLRLGFGLAAAAAYAEGSDIWLSIGGGFFIISMLLDRADGILARLSGKLSKFGHYFDLISDSVCNAAIFIGLGIGLRFTALGGWTVALGFLAGFAVMFILGVVMWAEGQKGLRAAELPSMAGFDAEDSTILIPIIVWLGWGLPLLYVSAAVTPLFAVYFAWLHRRMLRPAA
ncbi:MAG: CDP-alcohol phosphatidyltransferase family protein, partial [Hypericibacter sp.]